MASEPDDRYAIHAAAREGRLQQVESLLTVNPRLATRKDADDRLPLHWACAHNHLAILTLLSSQPKTFDPDAEDNSGWTGLMIASSLRDDAGLALIDLLLAKEADPKVAAHNGATALHLAASKGNLGVVRRLVEDAGVSARVKDRRGQGPLHRAAAVGSVPVVKVLLGPKGKAAVNASDVDGMTALHHAVGEGHGDVAVELLKAGAEHGKKDVDGRTAIECAPDAKVRHFVVQAAEREGIDL